MNTLMSFPKKRMSLAVVLGAVALVCALTGCPMFQDGNGEGGGEGGGEGEACPELTNTPTLASEWVGYVDWDAATTVTIGAHEVSETNFHFMPDHAEFTAGEPYIFVMESSEDNEEKHYFHAPEFYASGATRKAQTAHAEYKAPYFDDFELLIGGELELFFVPVRSGEYEFICTITGHRELGMVGELHTVCGDGLSLDLEIAEDFDLALADDARRSGSDLVWETVETVRVTMVEDSETEFRFDPPDLALTQGQAYILEIHNPSANSSKHYYTAAEFYKTLVTRKAQDSKAEIKVPYFKAIELKIGGTTQLFIVPTVVGTYDVLCTIEGHSDAGMTGTITVCPPELLNPPTLASEWVSYVDWDAATTVTIGVEETSETDFHFTPDRAEFTAGEPYIFVMQSPETNSEKHYFHAPEFYASGATRKAQTVHAEYKAPYFDDFELLVGGELELFFVPVLQGDHELMCTITGHLELGMLGELNTVCGDGLALDLEVAQDFNLALATDARRSGSDPVWETAETVTVTMVEDSETAFRFAPPDLTLTKDQAYILEISNPAGNSSKHYYTAAEFYKTLVTRKAQDSEAEIKVPYFKAVELKLGGTTQLFIVPTVAGVYDVLCTITGHSDAGMTGTITVVE